MVTPRVFKIVDGQGNIRIANVERKRNDTHLISHELQKFTSWRLRIQEIWKRKTVPKRNKAQEERFFRTFV